MNRNVFLRKISKLAAGGYFMLNSNLLNNPDHLLEEKDYESGGSESLTLFLSGDVMTGRGIDQILPFSTDPQLFESYAKSAKDYVLLAERTHGKIPANVSFKYIWGDAIEEFDKIQPDFRIINLETSVTQRGTPWQWKSIHYRMHPGNAPVLKAANIDVCILGNNHVLDWGYEGLEDTLESLRHEGIRTTGAGKSPEGAQKPAVPENGSGRVLVFSYGSPTAGVHRDWAVSDQKAGVNLLPGYGSDAAEKIIETVRKYRKEGDKVLVSVHWGGNYGYEVPENQQKLSHRLLDSGLIDLIHGHSSHHPKGMEVYNDRLILYGCGDLINDYEGISGREEYRSDLRLLYFPKLDASGKLISLEMTPLKSRRFQLKYTEEEETQWLVETLDRECNKFGASVEVSQKGRLRLLWN
jgi:poly-gamma-glutamate capsule biosynthesis protein CapA/YwtB (metallophosphatase superfamily)